MRTLTIEEQAGNVLKSTIVGKLLFTYSSPNARYVIPCHGSISVWRQLSYVLGFKIRIWGRQQNIPGVLDIGFVRLGERNTMAIKKTKQVTDNLTGTLSA
jgi:hypothetical protein